MTFINQTFVFLSCVVQFAYIFNAENILLEAYF